MFEGASEQEGSQRSRGASEKRRRDRLMRLQLSEVVKANGTYCTRAQGSGTGSFFMRVRDVDLLHRSSMLNFANCADDVPDKYAPEKYA